MMNSNSFFVGTISNFVGLRDELQQMQMQKQLNQEPSHRWGNNAGESVFRQESFGHVNSKHNQENRIEMRKSSKLTGNEK
jgi:hypothetical protein